MAMQREQNLYGDEAQVIRKSDDCTIYRIANDDGDVVMTSYQVFPGIELIYDDVHTQRCSFNRIDLGDILEINHCKEGRIECQFKDEFFYLSQGDLSISCKRDAGHDSYFPGGHYHGITIAIDIDRTPDCLSCFLDDVDIKPTALISKFCNSSKCFVMREKAEMEHIFSELYAVPETIRKGYFKVKVLEILLFLSGVDTSEATLAQHGTPKTQVVLAKRVCRYLSENMDKRLTTDQISEYFHVSPTLVKSSFRSVYGSSIYAFIKKQKMWEAALLLRRTDKTIMEIAGSFGYDNGSKFAKAFQNVLGMSPSEYRTAKEIGEPTR